jgi:arsenate reductase
MLVKFYEYKTCTTCQRALKYLEKKGIAYERLPIVESPPTVKELQQMLQYLKDRGGTLKNLFNTSGLQYRELKIGDKLKFGMSEEEAFELLSTNGKLIKRPFLLTSKSGAVGFQEEVWDACLAD